MKPDPKVLEAIEGQRFAAFVNAASSLSAFLDAARSWKEVEALSRLMGDSEAQQSVRDRALELLGKAFDPDFENPWDSAIAVYLFLLRDANKPFAIQIATKVDDAAHFWWARLLALEILPKRTLVTSEGSGVIHRVTFDAGEVLEFGGGDVAVKMLLALAVGYGRSQWAGNDRLLIGSRPANTSAGPFFVAFFGARDTATLDAPIFKTPPRQQMIESLLGRPSTKSRAGTKS